MLNSKVVTVFGGTGFVGRQLVQQLAAAGYVVRVATRDPVKANILRTAGAVGQIVPVLVSYKHENTLESAIKGSDAVVNLIGILYETGRQKFSKLQGELPGTLARLAAAHGAGNFIQISAIGADENSKSAYARAKAQGEKAAKVAFPTATILRPSIIFGPEDNFFNRFARMARVSPFLPLIGGGKNRYQPVYVGDVAQAILTVLAKPAAASRTYELGGPKAFTFKELMQITLQQSGQKRCLLNLPVPVAKLQASVMCIFTNSILTRDQIELLKVDNVVSDYDDQNVGYLWHLGIKPTPLEAVLPSYLSRFRPPVEQTKAA